MPTLRASVPAILAALAGLLFTSWVKPGTTGGFLLLLAVSGAVFLVLFTALNLLRLALVRARRPGTADRATFASLRGKTPAGPRKPGDPPG